MSIFDIYIAYVSWGTGGKKRPVLVLGVKQDTVTVFNITTRYVSKSETVRNRYFPITDWQAAGLIKQSYVDTNSTYNLPLSAVETDRPIGYLTDTDAEKLLEFMKI